MSQVTQSSQWSCTCLWRFAKSHDSLKSIDEPVGKDSPPWLSCTSTHLAGYAQNAGPSLHFTWTISQSSVCIQQPLEMRQYLSLGQKVCLLIACCKTVNPSGLFLSCKATHCVSSHPSEPIASPRGASWPWEIESNLPIFILLPLPWIVSLLTLTQESHLFGQHSWNNNKLIP